MPVQPGQMLSHYRLVEKLGEGGMGVVWKAEDTTLDREVAIKVLPDGLASDPERLARFEREAHLAATLNHPGICTIHEVGKVQAEQKSALGDDLRLEAGGPFIVMELVEGRTLDSEIRTSGALPLGDLLKISVQLAEALSAAHGKGIVHRDLKPGNVMLLPDDRVKILDFGLAKPLEPVDPLDEVMTAAETVSAELTREGRVLGTVAYMSPEQATGQPVDSRSDVFSFGIMIYEMTAGRRPFQGESSTSTLAKILETEPEPLDSLRADLPVELRRIIRRCLRKKPDDRYNDTRDLATALRELREESTSGSAQMASSVSAEAEGRQQKTRWLRWGFVSVAVIVVALVATKYGWKRPTSSTELAAQPTHRQLTFLGTADAPALSPDGRSVAFVSRETGTARVLMQDLEGGDPLEIFHANQVSSLRWSPSGAELLLDGMSDAGQYRLHVVPRLGGATRSFEADFPSFFDWGPDGVRFAYCVSTDVKSIFLFDKMTGEFEEVALAEPAEWIADLDWSPSGEWIALVTFDSDASKGAIQLVRPDGSHQKTILDFDYPVFIRWSPSSDALYYYQFEGASGDIWKFRIDRSTGQRTTDPVPVLSGLLGAAPLSISDDGRLLAYPKVTTFSNLRMVERGDEGSAGARGVTQVTTGTRLHPQASFSPEGDRIAYVRGLGLEANLFTQALQDGSPLQLTFFDALNWGPAWSPDGREIAFGSTQGGTPRIWRVGADGGTPRVLENTKTLLSSSLAWCRGSGIVYGTHANRNLRVLDPDTGEERLLVKDESVGWVFAGACSPDGTHLAVMWNRTWHDSDVRKFGPGIWVISLEDSSERLLLERKWSERFPMPIGWSNDALWVYVLDGMDFTDQAEVSDPQILRIPASGGEPELWMKLPIKKVDPLGADVTSDGRRFVGSHREILSDVWLTENFDPETN